MLQRQAAMVSFVTIFRGLGFLFLLLIPLVMPGSTIIPFL